MIFYLVVMTLVGASGTKVTESVTPIVNQQTCEAVGRTLAGMAHAAQASFGIQWACVAEKPE